MTDEAILHDTLKFINRETRYKSYVNIIDTLWKAYPIDKQEHLRRELLTKRLINLNMDNQWEFQLTSEGMLLIEQGKEKLEKDFLTFLTTNSDIKSFMVENFIKPDPRSPNTTNETDNGVIFLEDLKSRGLIYYDNEALAHVNKWFVDSGNAPEIKRWFDTLHEPLHVNLVVQSSLAGNPQEAKTSAEIFLDELNCEFYLVGSIWGRENQLKRFIEESIWEKGHEDNSYADIINNVSIGDILIIKSAFAADSVSMLRVKALGRVINNDNNGISLKVEWRIKDIEIDIEGLGHYRSTIAAVSHSDLIIIFSEIDRDLWPRLFVKKGNTFKGIINSLLNDVDKGEKETEILEDDQNSTDYQQSSPKSSQTIESNFLTDYYADTDSLNYELYAAAIVAFINHKNTRPPLTIGIMAPWGKGKTSLMRFIEKKLKVFPVIIPAQVATVEKGANDETVTFRLFRHWLNRAKEQFRYDKTLQYPTVWFNAWKFQKSEQVWAGFAYEIIHQLVSQLPTALAQEEFWLRLNLKRIDQEKLKNKIRFKMLNKAIASIWEVAIAIVSITICSLTHFSIFVDILGYGLIPISLAGYLLYKKGKVKKEKIDFDIEKYIKQPEYASKRGYFHEVEDDLKDVMNILVADSKPAVIFIDDLDRCAPNTVAEVVEAINLFISGDFPKCYFILGQDAQMVAASLDVAYNQFSDKTQNLFREQGSLGWHFMEKFVQLQFCIPVLNDEQAKTFFRNFFNSKPAPLELGDNLILKEKVAEFERKIDSGEKISDLLTADTLELERNLKVVDPLKAAQIQEKIIEKAASQYDDNDRDVLQLIEQLSKYIGTSPRSIKRFINLYRFYKFLQLTNRNLKLQATSSAHLGQWIVIMIRWPQLVRAIQWHTEGEFIKGENALERANGFEKLINQYANYNEWTEVIESFAIKLNWLKDIELYNFIRFIKKEKNSLANAVVMGVW